jgi:hypothetical protein
MMNQKKFETLLEDYLDGQLDEAERREFLDAVEQNAEWAEQLRAEEALQAMLRERRDPGLPEAFSANVMEAIRSNPTAEKKQSAIIYILHSRPAQLAAAAMLMAVVGLGVLSRIDLKGNVYETADAPAPSLAKSQAIKEDSEPASRITPARAEDAGSGSGNISGADSVTNGPRLTVIDGETPNFATDEEGSAISNMFAELEEDMDQDIGNIAMNLGEEKKVLDNVESKETAKFQTPKDKVAKAPTKALSATERTLKTEALLGESVATPEKPKQEGVKKTNPQYQPELGTSFGGEIWHLGDGTPDRGVIDKPEETKGDMLNKDDTNSPGTTGVMQDAPDPSATIELQEEPQKPEDEKLKSKRYFDLYAIEQQKPKPNRGEANGLQTLQDTTTKNSEDDKSRYDDAINLQKSVRPSINTAPRETPRPTPKPVAVTDRSTVWIYLDDNRDAPQAEATADSMAKIPSTRMRTSLDSSKLRRANTPQQAMVELLEKLDDAGIEIESISTNASGTTVVQCKVANKDMEWVEKTLEKYAISPSANTRAAQKGTESKFTVINRAKVPDDKVLHLELRIYLK